jgi:hypothetical protein
LTDSQTSCAIVASVAWFNVELDRQYDDAVSEASS